MRNSNGVPQEREINVNIANMEFDHDSYTYHEIPVKEDVTKYYVKGVPPGDAV